MRAPVPLRAESQSTSPAVAMTVTRSPRSLESLVHVSWSGAPSAHGTASPRSVASVVRRSRRVSISRRSSRVHSHGAATTSAPATATRAGTRNWRASLRLQRVGVELVSNTADRDDQFRGSIIPFDPLAQAPDVHIDGTRLDVHVLTPDQVQQLQAVVYPVRVANEEFQQLELAQREIGRLTLDEHLVSVEVHAQPAALEDLVRLRHVLAMSAAQHGAHAGDHLARTEWLRDVVVGTHLESDHPIDFRGPRREHDDRNGVGPLGAAKAPAHLEAVGTR